MATEIFPAAGWSQEQRPAATVPQKEAVKLGRRQEWGHTPWIVSGDPGMAEHPNILFRSLT